MYQYDYLRVTEDSKLPASEDDVVTIVQIIGVEVISGLAEIVSHDKQNACNGSRFEEREEGVDGNVG